MQAGRVLAGGQEYPLKQIRIVPANAAKSDMARAGAGGPEKKRSAGAPIFNALEGILQGEERMSMTKAAELLKEQLRADGKDYAAIMREVKGRLIDLIRLDPRCFQLVEQPQGTKTWYYVGLK